MVPKILIAYDGSDCSERALADLKNAGMPAKAEAVVLSVADSWTGHDQCWVDSGLNPQYAVIINNELQRTEVLLKEAKSLSCKAAEKLKTYFPNWTVRAEATTDLPAAAILDKNETWRPDLIVMGSHGRSAMGRLFMGSVSHKILTHAHCNLRISKKKDKKKGKYASLRILAAFDGSQESETAFQAMLCRNWPKNTHIRLVTVLDLRVGIAFAKPTGPIRYWMRGEDTNPVAWVDRMFAYQKTLIEKKGWIADSKMLNGDAKHVLLKEAGNWCADSIFVGTRGLTGHERMMLGSVSTALALHAPCAVEVVHRLWSQMDCCKNVQEQHRDCMTKT
jgi:nucleotide-binding universal stress UspA family protein